MACIIKNIFHQAVITSFFQYIIVAAWTLSGVSVNDEFYCLDLCHWLRPDAFLPTPTKSYKNNSNKGFAEVLVQHHSNKRFYHNTQLNSNRETPLLIWYNHCHNLSTYHILWNITCFRNCIKNGYLYICVDTYSRR